MAGNSAGDRTVGMLKPGLAGRRQAASPSAAGGITGGAPPGGVAVPEGDFGTVFGAGADSKSSPTA
jgi:hypothetical protein